MKRKFLALILGAVMMVAVFGTSCGRGNGDDLSDVGNSSQSPSGSSFPDIAEVCTATQFFPWIADLTADNVNSVQIRKGGTGAPNSLSTVTTSTDKTEVAIIVEYLNNLEFSKSLYGVDFPEGGLATRLTLATDENVYTLSEYFGILILDGQGYYFSENIPMLTTGETEFCFASLSGDSLLYIDGVEKKNYADFADKLLFVEKEDLTGFAYTGYELKIDGVTFVISDDKTFGIMDYDETAISSVYTVVGETDFSQIFADFPMAK